MGVPYKLSSRERSSLRGGQFTQQIKSVIGMCFRFSRSDMRVKRRGKEEPPRPSDIERGYDGDLVTAPANAPVIVDVWIWRTIHRAVHVEGLSLQCKKVVAVCPADEQTHRDGDRQGFMFVGRDIDDLRWGNINNPCAPRVPAGADDPIRQPTGVVVHFGEGNSCVRMGNELALQVIRIVIPLKQQLVRFQEQQPRLNVRFKRREM